MRFWKAFPALLTALAVGFVGCAPEDDIDPVDPVPVVDPVVTPDPVTPPPAGDVDAVIVAPAPEPGVGTTTPDPGFDATTPEPGAGAITPETGAAVPAPEVDADAEGAPAEEPLLQPEDAIEETPVP